MYPRAALIIVGLCVAIVAALIVRGACVADDVLSRVDVEVCEQGVAVPYRRLMSHMRELTDAGRTDELRAIIVEADTRSGEMSLVWKTAHANRGAYKEQVTALTQ